MSDIKFDDLDYEIISKREFDSSPKKTADSNFATEKQSDHLNIGADLKETKGRIVFHYV